MFFREESSQAIGRQKDQDIVFTHKRFMAINTSGGSVLLAPIPPLPLTWECGYYDALQNIWMPLPAA
jgi:hypothetical protein